MYEVLNYETTLEILDTRGKVAILRKNEQVKFLQNNVIAYQDQAWGDGKILANYRCAPGHPADFYRSGYKTYVLISLREVKNRGDIEEFNIEWGIKNGFLSKTGFWSTEISHHTNKVLVQVVFPHLRPPSRIWISGKNIQQINPTEQALKQTLPDGRWLIRWEKLHPLLNENYVLHWEW